MSGEGVGVLLGDQRKGIITMCIPIAVALLVQQLNNIVDSLWVSDLGGDSMAALGVVYPLYCVLIGIGNGLGIGVASAIARNIGRKDKANADGVAMQGMVLTVIVSVPIGLALFLTAGITTDLMGAGGMREECLGYAIPIYISSLFIILSGVVSGMPSGADAQATRQPRPLQSACRQYRMHRRARTAVCRACTAARLQPLCHFLPTGRAHLQF